MAGPESPGPPGAAGRGPSDRFTHTGHRFVLGYTPQDYGIWDRLAPAGPIRRYPRTDAGWAQAWREYATWEPNHAPVADPGAPPAAPGRDPLVYAIPYAPPPGSAPPVAANSKATASLVLGLVGLLFGIAAIVALVLGHASRREIDASGGRQAGRGSATAGIVLGWAGIALWLALIVTLVSRPG